MAGLITGLEAETVRAAAARVREEIAAAARRAGRDPAAVELLAAVKYIALEELGVLAEAGLTLSARTAPRSSRPRRPRTPSCAGTSSASSRAARSSRSSRTPS